MTRRRLYNPAQLTPEELKESFIARQDVLERMLEVLNGHERDRPCQHMMIVGPRGMGKTTLGLRFLHAAADNPGLAASWQPVPFHEESYGIGDLADFWLAALRHLTRATSDPRWSDLADALLKDERDAKRLAAYARAALSDFCRESGKRLILFVENLDALFAQIRDEREIHGLRASLIERPDLLLIGSSNAVFDGIRGHGEPFYEFFRLFVLEGLTTEETRRMVATLPGSEVPTVLARERGRLETIRRLTGGNPRLMVLTCQMLAESPLGEAFEVLERLIDEQTPYFKARIEELPAQARKIFHSLAEGWTPMMAREVAEAAKLASSHVSAQLRLLSERRYVRAVRLPHERKARYEVADRFYNIYVLLRFSRGNRQRLERLVVFLEDLFGQEAMRTMYPTALAALETRGASAREAADWLSVLTRQIVSDDEFDQREPWRRRAVDLARKLIGPDAPVIQEISEVGWMRRGLALFREERFADAAKAFRQATAERPEDPHAWFGAGTTLFRLKKYDEAAVVLRRVPEFIGMDDPLERRLLAIDALSTEMRALIELNRHDEGIATCERLTRYVRVDDPIDLRERSVKSLSLMGHVLSRAGHHAEAIAAWERVGEYADPDDPPTLRSKAVVALASCGIELQQLTRNDEAVASWQRVADYVGPDDPEDVRFAAAMSSGALGSALSEMKKYDEAVASWKTAVGYVHPGDASERREMLSGLLATDAETLYLAGKVAEAETVCGLALDVSSECGEAWHVRAASIVHAKDVARFTEAEDYARRAAGFLPETCSTLRMLSYILTVRGEWTEALKWLEEALRLNKEERERSALIASLISAVVANHGRAVKGMMERTGADRTMEPLWHAVRADLEEEIGPLPAEIADAANEIVNEFARMRGC